MKTNAIQLTEKEISILLEQWAKRNCIPLTNGFYGAQTTNSVTLSSLGDLVKSVITTIQVKENQA